MATYPNVNAANQYARDIVGGKILACQLTILACQRHLDDLERAKDPNWPYRFDKNKAERFLRFAQKMPHTAGEWARRKLRIEFEPWQKFALGAPFGWVNKKSGLRRFTEIYIEVPRKNGKSAIAAAVGNYMFCADGEYGAEVYCGATTEKQAWKVFAPALSMVKKLPALRQKFSIKPWAKKMTRPDGSVFAPVIGDPGDGDSPSCAIIDEYHEHITDALYTTMTTGMGAREQPLTLIITTAGYDITSPCYEKREQVVEILRNTRTGEENEGIFGIIYGLDDDDDWTRPEALIKANPNYGISVKEHFLRAKQLLAISNPSQTNKILTKHFNRWVSAKTVFYDLQKWMTAADKSLKLSDFADEECWLGIDLASKVDLNAVVPVFRRDIEGITHFYCVEPMFWVPGTSITSTPPAVQHLTTEILAEDGQYQARARWDTPRVVKGVNFSLRLTVKAEDNSDRLVSNLTLTETEHTFRNLMPGRYTLMVRAVNSQGQQGDHASTDFSIAAPAVPAYVELTPGYFQITATPRQAVYDPTVQYEFWFSEKKITDIRHVETDTRYLGTALYWIAAGTAIKPGKDYFFYIRSVNQAGKSAFMEATGQASNDAAGYLDFFKGEITESHLGKELLDKVELTEDNASRLEEFAKEWQDVSGKWNAMWGVKIEQTEDGKHYVAGLGLSMEDTEEGKVSQFLVAANRIAFIDPANGNETPMFVAQNNQIFMNEVFLKYLTAPTITSGGSPPAFSLTPDGKLTARKADISGEIKASSGTLNNVVIEEDCTIRGTLRAERILGDIVKAAGKEFPYFLVPNTGEKRYASGTLTVVINDDESFDRQIIIPPVIYQGRTYLNTASNEVRDECTLEVKRNGVQIYRGTSSSVPETYSAVLELPAAKGRTTLTFSVSTKGNGTGWPFSSISDLLIMVTKKGTAGITIS
ncbi:TPA: DUF1983 domain-containing protein [Citrobacter farmeri]|nr:DUF1983 domain-containing protein [Citrobacter farmeri]HAT2776378.1 DUF1983 domain-containing protein [Citrobacter farmeri]HAT2807343.1 DUF1983 domain-containing protein [Citrobacter farmeri]